MRLIKSQAPNVFISLACLFAFSVVTIIPSGFFYSVFLFAIVAIMVFFTRWHLVDKKLLKFFGFFLLPSLLGLFSYPVSMVLEGDVFDYNQLNVFGRVANLSFLLFFILLLHTYIKDKGFHTPFRWYWLGAGLLMLTALWQFADVFLNVVDFPFETRAHLHSTGGREYGFYNRLTGIAREPSYFVMFAIDFIVLSVLFSYGVRKLIVVGLGLFLIILSLSPSGYITLAGAFGAAYFFTQIKFSRFKVSFKGLFAVLSFLVLLPVVSVHLFSLGYFDYVYNRVASPEMVESARAYMGYMPFVWAWDSNAMSYLFGHGIKSYSIIGTAFNLPSGEPVHVTSNNLYADTFWESGLFGLILIAAFFVFVFFSILNSKHGKAQVFVAFLVLFDLMLSSLFRADFASFRFFILLYLVYILIHYDLRNAKGFYV
ncbi:MAG TPA: hypothetical protein VKY34_03945 [Xanthomarina sp.]|nr:hypothetical protein [Xanthomarina sp.]